MKTEAVPVLLFTYARPEHTARVLDGLRAERIPHLIVYSDAPKREEHVALVEQVRALVGSIDWCEKEVHLQEVNRGLSESITTGVSAAMERFGYAIVLEDDILVLPGFYRFMTQALERYRTERRVYSICSYTMPHYCNLCPEYDGFFLPRSSSWGWATWKDRWGDFTMDLDELLDGIEEAGMDLESVGKDIPTYVAQCRSGRDVWAICWHLTQFLKGGLNLYPNETLSLNLGLDASGENCGVGLARRYKPRSERMQVKKEYVLPPAGKIDPSYYKQLSEQYGYASRSSFLQRLLKQIRGRIRP
ncbi:hypothetical protein KQI84_03630 [bacterium]|nr:hypothetical protein [bacterium]